MSFDPEFLDTQLPEPASPDSHRRFVDELDWHLSEMEALRAELQRARAEADRRLDEEITALRAQHTADVAVALETQRASLDSALRRSIAAEIEARLSEDYLERLKASQEAREKAAEAERAYLKERFDSELAQAVAEANRRAQREAETATRASHDKALDDALAEARRKNQEEREASAARHAQALAELGRKIETLNREKDALQSRLAKEAEAAAEARGKTLAELRVEQDRKVEAAVAEYKSAHAREVAELNEQLEAQAKRHADAAARELSELKKTHEKELALLGTQKDLESAQARRELEAAHQNSFLEIRKKVQEEAQHELQNRTERMKAEWDKLRVRFDDELTKIRAEMKRRETIWEEKVKIAESEGAAKSVEMNAKLLNLEDSVGRLEREKKAMIAELSDNRAARDRDSADLAGYKVTSDAALKQVTAERGKLAEEKAALEARLAESVKSLEGKLKAIEVQLRDERKKNVEWEQKYKELEAKSVWDKLRGK